MDESRKRQALDILMQMKNQVLENFVEEVLQQQETDSLSYMFQELEDKYSNRLSNLNVLIANLQEDPFQDEIPATKIITNVTETSFSQLEKTLEEVTEFMSPENLLHISVVPTDKGKYLVISMSGE
ncbi:MAG: hypothetical protein KBC30_05835 [Planctomycetes bacterium]|jgi:hypothetical protein|nr:hypothetical protein [Planctomycetota bacterium]HNZ67145.1 hypothetical protein [Planctomycetota bacterium]HPY75142.1 hypothetical protein [Planctomycetota bacterium]HQB00749.1 hypothetical protein [Planctomycetota bacterium]HRU52666.1 hypothetical protein [Planctomycetota bacterium]